MVKWYMWLIDAGEMAALDTVLNIQIQEYTKMISKHQKHTQLLAIWNHHRQRWCQDPYTDWIWLLVHQDSFLTRPCQLDQVTTTKKTLQGEECCLSSHNPTLLLHQWPCRLQTGQYRYHWLYGNHQAQKWQIASTQFGNNWISTALKGITIMIHSEIIWTSLVYISCNAD